jgi:hypothetical protein
MPRFIRENPPFSVESLSVGSAASETGAISREASVSSAAIGAIAVRNVIIDVGGGTVVPTIVRGGKEITAPALNQNRVDDFLAHVSILPRLLVPVAVSQSIPPGTMVPKGTPVDIVFVPMSNINFGLFDQTHADLATRAVTDVLPIIQDPAVAAALGKASAADLTPAEKQAVTDKLRTINVNVDETNPGKTFGLAFNSLKGARAFQ